MVRDSTRSKDEVIVAKGDLALSRPSSGCVQKPCVIHNYGPVQGVHILAVYRSLVDSEEVINTNFRRR